MVKQNNQEKVPVQDLDHKMGFLTALKDPLRIKLPTAITGRNSGKFLPSSPLLTRLQCYVFFHRSSLHTQHMLVLIISKISHGLCLLIPGIPYHCRGKSHEIPHCWKTYLINSTGSMETEENKCLAERKLCIEYMYSVHRQGIQKMWIITMLWLGSYKIKKTTVSNLLADGP